MNRYIPKNKDRANLLNNNYLRLFKSSSLNDINSNRFHKRNIEYDLYYKLPLNKNLSFSEYEILPFQRDNDYILKAYNKYIENKKKIIENNSKNHLIYLSKLFNQNKGKFPFKNYIFEKKNNNNNSKKIGEFIPSLIKSRHTDINGQKYFEHDLSPNGLLIGETPENSYQYKNFIDNKKKYYLNYNENSAFKNKKNNSKDEINLVNSYFIDNYKYRNVNKSVIPKIKQNINEIINISISDRSEREGNFKHLPLIKRINFKDNIESLIKIPYK